MGAGAFITGIALGFLIAIALCVALFLYVRPFASAGQAGFTAFRGAKSIWTCWKRRKGKERGKMDVEAAGGIAVDSDRKRDGELKGFVLSVGKKRGMEEIEDRRLMDVSEVGKGKGKEKMELDVGEAGQRGYSRADEVHQGWKTNMPREQASHSEAGQVLGMPVAPQRLYFPTETNWSSVHTQPVLVSSLRAAAPHDKYHAAPPAAFNPPSHTPSLPSCPPPQPPQRSSHDTEHTPQPLPARLNTLSSFTPNPVDDRVFSNVRDVPNSPLRSVSQARRNAVSVGPNEGVRPGVVERYGR